MSDNEIIERVQKNVESPTISTDTGLEAARKIGEIAEGENVEWALVGGIAMYLYGSPRLTKDVDIIASNVVSLKANAPLTFGGSNYVIEVGKYKVAVDWIVRSDGYAKYYRAALEEAVVFPNRMRLISPVWLVILKMFAGRQKDYDDAIFLLKEKDLVNRSKVKETIVRVGSEDAWLATLAGFRRLCSLADGKTIEASKYYDEE
ncbi:MAG TPA: hypothetical protein VGP58_07435 [Pyrinomonadaceae bacterium]|nr:hypothetical protein [Pyrinomonadaceae bacterium]